MTSSTPNIKDFTLEELQQWFAANGLTAYRARQVFHWLYQKRVESFEDMSSMGKVLRQQLAESFHISGLKRNRQVVSGDGSIKYAFGLQDGQQIETVLMPHEDHYTLCVSSQVGCAMGCNFCMTAKMGLIRNLSPGEIVDQVLEAWKDATRFEGIRNIVFMGMGEPFHNYDNVIKALKILQSEFGFNYSQRRITVSTSGLVPQIIRFGTENVKANLAISLNGVTDEQRTRLMPVNKAYDLRKLIEACKAFPLDARKRITFEYILIAGETDSLQDARALIKLLHGLRFKINLIPYNATPGMPYQRPDWEAVRSFQQLLLDSRITATLRISKGQDIQGACGQLIQEKKSA